MASSRHDKMGEALVVGVDVEDASQPGARADGQYESHELILFQGKIITNIFLIASITNSQYRCHSCHGSMISPLHNKGARSIFDSTVANTLSFPIYDDTPQVECYISTSPDKQKWHFCDIWLEGYALLFTPL